MWDRLNAKAEPRRRIPFRFVVVAFKLTAVISYLLLQGLGLSESALDAALSVLAIGFLTGWPIANRMLR